jgi:hypothetical protein
MRRRGLNCVKSMSAPCLIALIGACRELAACRGTKLVDGTGHRGSDFAAQRNAADRLRFGTAHRDTVGRDGNRQRRRNASQCLKIGFAPIERYAEMRAAGSACLTHLTHKSELDRWSICAGPPRLPSRASCTGRKPCTDSSSACRAVQWLPNDAFEQVAQHFPKRVTGCFNGC